MDEKVLNKVFEKDLTTGLGHGIGLNFCKEAMNKMNGDIICHSKLDQGTKFIITFN